MRTSHRTRFHKRDIHFIDCVNDPPALKAVVMNGSYFPNESFLNNVTFTLIVSDKQKVWIRLYNLIHICIILFGISGNFLVIKFLRGKNSAPRTPVTALIETLAWNDLLTNIVGTPLSAISSFGNRWTYGRLICQVYGTAMSFSGYMDGCLVALIAVERYEVITDLSRKYLITNANVVTMSVSAAVFCLVTALIPILGK